jgi:hypothetical protein
MFLELVDENGLEVLTGLARPPAGPLAPAPQRPPAAPERRTNYRIPSHTARSSPAGSSTTATSSASSPVVRRAAS